MAVIVSGVGVVAMAGAVGYAMAHFQPASPSLVNLGIAGHRDEALGVLFLADKIFSGSSPEKVYYPQFIGSIPCAAATLCTVMQPTLDYPCGFLYDMEGCAFYEMAARFSSCELIHCLKVVSDNAAESARQVNAKLVRRLMERNAVPVDDIIRHLAGLREHALETVPKQYQALTESHHFTVTGKIRLRSMLARRTVISQGEAAEIHPADFSSARQLLRWLAEDLDQTEFKL